MKKNFIGNEKAVFFRGGMALGDPDLLREVISSPPMNTLVSAPSDAMIIKQRWKLKDGSDEFKMDLVGLEDERSLLSRVLYKNHNRFHKRRNTHRRWFFQGEIGLKGGKGTKGA